MKLDSLDSAQFHDFPASEQVLDNYWSKFNQLFPSEEDCMEEIVQFLLQTVGKTCKYCSEDLVDREYGSRTLRCQLCGKTNWITSGTFFHRIKAARPWLGAFWLLGHGMAISSLKFHKLVDIAPSSASQIFKKISFVVSNQLHDDSDRFSSSCFLPMICKRSRVTPAYQHPSVEEVEIAKIVNGDIEKDTSNCIGNHAADSQDKSKDLRGSDLIIYRALSDIPTHIDRLSVVCGMQISELIPRLIFLELDGIVTSLPGNQFIQARCELKDNKSPISLILAGKPNSIDSRAKLVENPKLLSLKLSERAISSINKSVIFVRSVFHGISRKYLQNYLSLFWCYLNRVDWSPTNLIGKCIGYGYLSFSKIYDYVTPPTVYLGKLQN